MNKINLKGITSEAITNVLILVVALINAILQMLGINTLPIENEELSAIVSGVFLVGMALWNTWKNRNVTTVSQETLTARRRIRRFLRSPRLHSAGGFPVQQSGNYCT